jgi:hypothetical protein
MIFTKDADELQDRVSWVVTGGKVLRCTQADTRSGIQTNKQTNKQTTRHLPESYRRRAPMDLRAQSYVPSRSTTLVEQETKYGNASGEGYDINIQIPIYVSLLTIQEFVIGQ